MHNHEQKTEHKSFAGVPTRFESPLKGKAEIPNG